MPGGLSESGREAKGFTQRRKGAKIKEKSTSVIEKRSFLGELGGLSEAGVRKKVSRKDAKAQR